MVSPSRLLLVFIFVFQLCFVCQAGGRSDCVQLTPGCRASWGLLETTKDDHIIQLGSKHYKKEQKNICIIIVKKNENRNSFLKLAKISVYLDNIAYHILLYSWYGYLDANSKHKLILFPGIDIWLFFFQIIFDIILVFDIWLLLIFVWADIVVREGWKKSIKKYGKYGNIKRYFFHFSPFLYLYIYILHGRIWNIFLFSFP